MNETGHKIQDARLYLKFNQSQNSCQNNEERGPPLTSSHQIIHTAAGQL